MTENSAADPAERFYALAGYGLFFLGIVNGITALIGVILAYLRRGPARDTVWDSHYRNLILLFWAVLLLWAVVAAILLHGVLAALFYFVWPAWHPLFLFELPALVAAIPALLLGGALFAVWYFYRLVRGFLHALDEKPY